MRRLVAICVRTGRRRTLGVVPLGLYAWINAPRRPLRFKKEADGSEKSCVAACLNLGRISGELLHKCSWNGCPSERGVPLRKAQPAASQKKMIFRLRLLGLPNHLFCEPTFTLRIETTIRSIACVRSRRSTARPVFLKNGSLLRTPSL